MELPYYIVDAFTNARFTGNAAAIVVDAVELSDQQMQAVAGEFNLSETTFVLPARVPDADLRFRWFTPTTEVSMCGHATIGGVHALHEAGLLPIKGESQSNAIGIETLSGTLSAVVEQMPSNERGTIIWLDLIPPTLDDFSPDLAELGGILGIESEALSESLPPVRTQDKDAIAFVNDFQVLNDAKPDFGRLSAWQQRHNLRGLCLATTHTLSAGIHVQSRFFAPAAGIDEDPVTGSVHGPLAAYLVRHQLVPLHDGHAGMQCVQGIPGRRSGVVWVLAKPESDGSTSVRIGGQAVTTMRGMLVL